VHQTNSKKADSLTTLTLRGELNGQRSDEGDSRLAINLLLHDGSTYQPDCDRHGGEAQSDFP
jgi:hypothetical protein